MEKIKTIVISTLLVALIAVNAMVAVGDINPKAGLSLSLKSITNLAFAASEETSDCQPECSPGFACVNGVCVQREAATRTSCTATVFCWLQFRWKDAPGHQTTCPSNPGGITNCSGTACEPDVDPC